MNRLLPILLIALLATACCKEEVVAPCHGPDEVETTSKNLAPAHGLADPADPHAVGNGTVKPPSDGVDISDDGDDLSDSERSRKKRR